MLGAILGDMIGAPYEFDMGNKSKDFPLFSRYSCFTDDSVMTIAVAEALMNTMGEDDETIKKEDRKGKRVQITASTSFFVPKPFTPFQWASQCTKEEFLEEVKSAGFRIEESDKEVSPSEKGSFGMYIDDKPIEEVYDELDRIYETAKDFSKFYQNCSIVNAGDTKLAGARLYLAQCTLQVIKNAMNLVLVPYLEKM